MILTDREIGAALKMRHIVIDPSPSPESFSSTSVDLTLLDRFTTWKSGKGLSIDVGDPEYKYSEILHLQETHTVESFIIKPKEFVLAWTKEFVEIPIHSRLAARVEGKSSLARLGIGVHITAPTVHSGFKGNIQLEMYNFGPHNITLRSGMSVCQLIFEQTLGTPDKGYGGMFLDQKG